VNDQEKHPEIASFQSLWSGGYFEGDPLDPLGQSTYGRLGYMSVLHATYLACIKPYVTSSTVALEIGPGRGAWSKCLLGAGRLYCLDALSAEHNGFWDYVGRHERVTYEQVKDFSASAVPDDSIEYLFSYGTFCHLSPPAIREYLTSLLAKLRPGAHGFVMFADYEKYNRAATDLSLGWERALPGAARAAITAYRSLRRPKLVESGGGLQPSPGRWYHMGTEPMVELLASLGYVVLDPDMGVNHRDPVVHFVRP
jgi:hypothetical protein